MLRCPSAVRRYGRDHAAWPATSRTPSSSWEGSPRRSGHASGSPAARSLCCAACSTPTLARASGCTGRPSLQPRCARRTGRSWAQPSRRARASSSPPPSAARRSARRSPRGSRSPRGGGSRLAPARAGPPPGRRSAAARPGSGSTGGLRACCSSSCRRSARLSAGGRPSPPPRRRRRLAPAPRRGRASPGSSRTGFGPRGRRQRPSSPARGPWVPPCRLLASKRWRWPVRGGTRGAPRGPWRLEGQAPGTPLRASTRRRRSRP
mmetsp:Transcript_116874/g.317298  ORF Transcript_116874/g.317298 Transcript_116874/m.317298 type:complete len:263 (-) Transcript_116874:1105-1893(-)